VHRTEYREASLYIMKTLSFRCCIQTLLQNWGKYQRKYRRSIVHLLLKLYIHLWKDWPKIQRTYCISNYMWHLTSAIWL